MTNLEYIEQKNHEEAARGKFVFTMPCILSQVFARDLFFENIMDVYDKIEARFTPWKEKNPDDYAAIEKAYMAYRDAIKEHCWNKEKNW